MDLEKRFELIKRNTEEILGEEELKELLKEKKKPVIYWGTTPTGKPHVGYFFPMLKIADLLKAGFKVKILLADLHAALDNVPWIVLEKHYSYYEKVIPKILEAIGVDTKDLEFVKGSDFQLKPEYMFDVLRMSSFVSAHDANKAASEVVKQGDNPRLSGFIYPIMQAMDEQYLEADAQLGGTDQRKIMVLARENLPRLGYSPRVEIMHALIPGLIGRKMSSSDEKSKIDLLDNEEEVRKKVNSAEFVVGNIDNGVMAFLKYVIMTIKQDKKQKFIIKRDKKYGGDKEYKSYEEIEKDFIDGKLHPLDLKNAVAEEVNSLLSIFRKNKKEFENLAKEAYE